MTNKILHAAIFVLTLHETTGCGGSYVGSGNITSPNYPYKYPPNSRCAWTLTATAEHDISLRLINLDTEKERDFISVYKGVVQENSFPTNYLRRYSGQSNISSYYDHYNETLVVGPTATVVFFSDHSWEASGFQMEFSSVKSVKITPYTECGGSFFGDGNITSPNYPNLYPKNSRCTWSLTANPGSFISLKVIHMDTESSYDYVYVFNGTSAPNSSLSDYYVRYSGHNSYEYSQWFLSGEWTSDTTYYEFKPLQLLPSVTILFTSDFSVSDTGFRIEYMDVTPFTSCGGSFFGDGYIQSPNYPNLYPMNSFCTWSLTANPGTYLSVKFNNIDTERWYDYVYVFNGTVDPNSSLSNYYRRYSGIMTDDYFYWNKQTRVGPSATIVFISDFSVSAGGFQLEYTSIDVSPFTSCGGHIFGSGTITSPENPKTDRYPPNCLCSWTLSATPGSFISMKLVYFSTESFMDFRFDYLMVFNGTRTSNSSLSDYLKLYRGHEESPFKTVINSSSATIVFVSDDTVEAIGFQMEFSSIDFIPYTECGGSFFGDGNITSPNYPNLYPMNSRCTWSLTANPGSFISLKIIHMDTESSYDYVYVFNGTRAPNSSLSDYYVRYSGHDRINHKTQRFLTVEDIHNYELQPLLLGPSVTVVFISDFSVSDTGFQIEYTGIDVTPFTNCGGRNFGSGNITSPNYPNQYPMNCLCYWTLSANPGSLIVITVLRLDTEKYHDFVEVFQGTKRTIPWSGYYYRRYSGNDSRDYNSKLIPPGPNVTILFFSDHSVSATGFHIEYATVDVTPFTSCGGSFFGDGNITSPNYPNPYPINSHCTWSLAANPGSYISLRIISFDTEMDLDYVDVFNYTIPPSYSRSDYYRRYSGNDSSNYTLQPIRLGPNATIVFFSDYSVSAKGFQIEYTTVDVPPFTRRTIATSLVTSSNTVTASITKGAATPAADTSVMAAITPAAISDTGMTNSLAGSSTAAKASATSDPPVRTKRPCKLRRNTTASALQNP